MNKIKHLNNVVSYTDLQYKVNQIRKIGYEIEGLKTTAKGGLILIIKTQEKQE